MMRFRRLRLLSLVPWPLSLRLALVASFVLVGGPLSGLARAADSVIPHGQDKPPGAALSPAEAMKKMTLPPGFAVELVAAEPDIINPVAMTIDERGRFWITESVEYPRHDAGPGRDRIKVFESTKGDGHYDKITVFADGLNIPSGIAVGHGGVWVCNSPDILFMQDTHGTGQADKREVVVTGFGRYDTHELPNSLTWGPDGYLYGLNGVFNEAVVKQRGKEFRFTCAMFRINPRTRDFELFCEGTSNPWGIAWDPEGSAFISACVVDHLWHLTETGYYQRQGGPYPPFTWILPSIVKQHHQKAAYCGLLYLDTDAFPEKYRDKLLMGNIHGDCLNVDSLSRNGSTYIGDVEPDFLTANDAWFMPVSQKIGPDGCLYVLDWYDRYHCYQDAQRDAAGIDRSKGRLYRISYKGTPQAGKIDLGKESDAQLVERLKSPNIYYRETAQRLLAERNSADARPLLEKLVLDSTAPHKARMHALWSLIGAGPLDKEFHLKLFKDADPTIRAWAVRAMGNQAKIAEKLGPAIERQLIALGGDSSPDVQLQIAIAAVKLNPGNPAGELLDVLARAGKDPLIPAVVWQNLSPLLEDHADEILKKVAENEELRRSPEFAEFLPRLIERVMGRAKPDIEPIVSLFALVSNGDHPDVGASQKCLAMLALKIQNRELTGPRLDELKVKLEPLLAQVIAGRGKSPLFTDAALLATTWNDRVAIDAIRKMLVATDQPDARRLQALGALLAARDRTALDAVAAILAEPKQNSAALRAAILGALGRAEDARVGEFVLKSYRLLEPELQPKAIELLTQRPEWAMPLLEAIGRQEIPSSTLNVNQVQKLLASRDKDLIALVTAKWGSIRADRNPQREQVVADVRKLLQKQHGDAKQGELVFKKVCAQCHKIYGEGQDVGPDISANGRASFDQLLSNVLDPSLVIGASYQARLVTTTDGRSLTGLLVEDSPQRVVLKEQGGKLDTIPRGEVDAITVSKLSLMPEGLEKQLTEKELVDLFEFLLWDKHPSDRAAKRLPGAPR
jgi:putative heme-binding domain-containing protein